MMSKIKESSRKLVTKVDSCMGCPNNISCKVWRGLTQRERVYIALSPSAPSILPNCPLPVYEETEYE